jgi:hypothetical protein
MVVVVVVVVGPLPATDPHQHVLKGPPHLRRPRTCRRRQSRLPVTVVVGMAQLLPLAVQRRSPRARTDWSTLQRLT